MQKALDRMVKLKRPILERKSMDLQLQQNDRSGNQVVILENVGKAYGERSLFTDANEVLRYGETTALIGGNGAGKSTLLRIILGQETPDTGSCTLGSRAVVGYLAQEAVPENNKQSVLRYFREEAGLEEGEARGQLARFLFYGADVFKDITNLSGGEWTRLRFAVLMHRKPNLLILDEPTNHLDIDSREALEEALEEFPGTVLAVSHDRYFINRLFHKLWSIESGRFGVFNGNYEYYKEKQAVQALVVPVSIPDQPKPTSSEGTTSSRSGKPQSSGSMNVTTANSSSSRKKSVHFDWEKAIAEVEEQLEEIDVKMLDPQISSNAAELAELLKERDTVQEQLDELYAGWMETTGH
jgi:ABC-type multidrug transport system ATPase subunit